MLPHFVFESLFEHSPVGEYLLSPSDDPVILAVNETFLRASGRTREALVGRRLFEAFPGNPDDAGDTGVTALRASLARVIATRQSDAMPLQRYPIRVVGSDGTEAYEERFWQATSTPIFGPDGILVCIDHRTQDVTEQARVAEALRRSTARQTFQLAVADRLRGLTSPDEIAGAASAMLAEKFQIARVTYVEVDDASGTLVQRHWVRSGQEPAEPERRTLEEFGPEVIDTLRRGQPLVIHDVDTDPRTLAHAVAYASVGVRSNLAIPLVKSERLSLVLSLQHDQPRAWSGHEIELATDVAERTWAAAENARAQEELRQASRRKDEFLAMLAHELRNPLAPISAASELLSRHPVDEERLHRISTIIGRQVRHMTALVDDLLDVSRVTRGQVVLSHRPQDIKTVIAGALEQARPLIERHRHRLTVDLPPVAAMVSGDDKRLVQVVTNLLTNAAKYTPPGGLIQVSAGVDEDHVQIHVKDNGLGIPKDLQPRIFELFAQAERSPDRSQGGLGLGLALVRSLVELHRGTVTVSSAGPGAGSCFVVTLPRLASGATPGEDHSRPEARRLASRPLDILVVDDNTDAAEMLKLLLEGAGHRVRTEYDPLGALQAAGEQPPEAAFIDIGLPGMDGYELVRRLRGSPATAAGTYIALTGYGHDSDRANALAAGFNEHLVKPAAPEHVFDLLDRVASR